MKRVSGRTAFLIGGVAGFLQTLLFALLAFSPTLVEFTPWIAEISLPYQTLFIVFILPVNSLVSSALSLVDNVDGPAIIAAFLTAPIIVYGLIAVLLASKDRRKVLLAAGIIALLLVHSAYAYFTFSFPTS